MGITQPRRVAAMSVAARVSEETGLFLGDEVGYSIRFDNCTSSKTCIKFMTDGILVRETMSDPLLSRYSVLILDEAHERTLYTDILFGLVKKILRRRPDLRVLVSSATVDADEIKAFFSTNYSGLPENDNVYIMSIEGRTHPVDIHYRLQPTSDYLAATLATVFDIHNTQPPGDILVFLTGTEEIEGMIDMIVEKNKRNHHPQRVGLKALPIYSGLPAQQQLLVFQPLQGKNRKAVVATNIAETSLTIDGIVYVVDCGFVKSKSFNPRSGMEMLLVTPVSQASAKQRAGRAGRNRPGKCYRLYTEDAFDSLRLATVPEIQRTNLTTLILQLKFLGVDDILHFDFVTPPPVETMAAALESLYALGALDTEANLTNPLGRQMSEFPVDPPLSKMILSSATYGCGEEILTIAAMVSLGSIYSQTKNQHAAELKRQKYAVEEGDHLTLLNLFNAFVRARAHAQQWCADFYLNVKAMARAVEIRRQLKGYAKRFGLELKSTDDTVAIRKCTTAANRRHLLRLLCQCGLSAGHGRLPDVPRRPPPLHPSELHSLQSQAA